MREEFKRIRKENGFTIRGLAEKMNVAYAFLSQIEQGHRYGKVGFWVKFQDTFNIPDEEMWKIIKNRSC